MTSWRIPDWLSRGSDRKLLLQAEGYLAKNLFSWMRADSVTLSSGLVTSMVDRVNSGVGAKSVSASHAFAQATAANQCDAPAVSSLLNSRPVLTFVRTDPNTYVSNIPVANWRFPHDGTGFECWATVVPTTLSRSDVLTSRPAVGAAETGFLMGWGVASGTARAFVQNGVSSAVDTTDLGSIVVNTPTILNFSYRESVTPEYAFRQLTTTLGSGSSGAAPAAGNPDLAMTIGAGAVGPCGMLLGDVMIANQVNDTLRSAVQVYNKLRYNLGP